MLNVYCMYAAFDSLQPHTFNKHAEDLIKLKNFHVEDPCSNVLSAGPV